MCWTHWNKCYEDTKMKDNIKILDTLWSLTSQGSRRPRLTWATPILGSTRGDSRNSCCHNSIIKGDCALRFSSPCLCNPCFPELYQSWHHEAWVTSTRAFVTLHLKRSYLTPCTAQCVPFWQVLWLLSLCTASSSACLEPHCILTLCTCLLVPLALLPSLTSLKKC